MYVRFGLKVDLLENQTNTFMHFIFNFYLKNLPLKPLKKFGKILEFTDVTNVTNEESNLDAFSCTFILTSYTYNEQDGKVVNINNNNTIA